MRIVLFCVLALASIGAPQSVRAQEAAAPATAEPAQAPAVTVTAPASTQANTAKPESASEGPTADELFAYLWMGVLAAAAVAFAILFVAQIRAGAPVGIESHWGGLGGGLGGWRISSSLCFLILSLAFAIAFTALATSYLDRDSPRQTAAAKMPAAGNTK